MDRSVIFTEQAEYIASDEFDRVLVEHPNEAALLKKLTQGGAKLITGPRGCGKTTLMLKAYRQMLTDDSVLPIYVNFRRSLALEPSYKSGPEGTYWFSQWIYLKLYQGLHEVFKDLGEEVRVTVTADNAAKWAGLLEMADLSSVPRFDFTMGQFEADIEAALSSVNRRRCVLLLDDAAHAFSPEQQRDFFDFFRQVKTRSISPKAAIYPGVTSYSSSFHVGHDAEELDVWFTPDNAGYLDFMRRLIEQRLPPEISEELLKDQEVANIICYGAFGIPRALITMIQSVATLDEDDVDGEFKISLNRAQAVRAVKSYYERVLVLFKSIKDKMPMYDNFIGNGLTVLENAFKSLKAYNESRDIGRQSAAIAINQGDMTHEFTRLFSLMQYAGLCVPKGEMSRGEGQKYRVFLLHYAGIVNWNAMLGKRAVNVPDYNRAFNGQDFYQVVRIRGKVLTQNQSPEQLFQLALPPCPVCDAPRPNKDARFCSNCGSPLKSLSSYLNLIGQDIEKLPLTAARVKNIKQQSSIRTIKDILIDHEHRELMKVEMIGKVWASKIVAMAEEYVE